MSRVGLPRGEIAVYLMSGAERKRKMPVTEDASKTGMTGRKWRWPIVLLLTAVTLGLLWGSWKCWEAWRYETAIAQIEEEIEKGLYGRAAKDLVALLAWHSGSDEAAFLLGTCESARGRTQAASEAWALIPPDSSFSPKAMVGLMELRIERGRFAEAEAFIEHARDNSVTGRSDVIILLGPLFCQQGRVAEAERFIEERYDHLNQKGEGASEKAVNLVRLHIEIRTKTAPVEAIRSALDHAAQLARDDDRIWLGKANLAIREGLYDEAAGWLDSCLRLRPDDVPVWRARLNWAVATGRAKQASEALVHLPATESAPAQVQKLAAWFAAQRGDTAAEGRALERLIESDPSDLDALNRLAEMSLKAKQPDRATEFRRKKTEIERLQARYQKLYARNQPRRDAAEMARLAEQLGQRFEAKVFLALAAAVDPDREGLQTELARLNQHSGTIENRSRTLADLLAPDLGSDEPNAGRTNP
jgi:enediyne biosynthesis protein E4